MVNLISKVLKVFAENGLFEEGIELIGSWCFKLYEKHLGAKSFPLMTQDIDFLIPNPFKGKEHAGFIEQLEGLGFSRDFKAGGALYLWNADLKIEFITPEKGRGGESSKRFKNLGLSAIPLRFVDLLLEEPIALVEGGVNILLPNPANFCLHKLIIASRRRRIDKSLKDLQQALSTSVIVDKVKIRKLFDSLPDKWRDAIFKMLGKAEKELPLFAEEIENVRLTLQLG